MYASASMGKELLSPGEADDRLVAAKQGDLLRVVHVSRGVSAGAGPTAAGPQMSS